MAVHPCGTCSWQLLGSGDFVSRTHYPALRLDLTARVTSGVTHTNYLSFSHHGCDITAAGYTWYVKDRRVNARFFH